jgi:membrane protein implicated in regulation of membrane protease activity
VISLYVASLVAGIGILGVQLFAGHDAGGGHDVHHDDAAHDLTPWTILTGVRFWSFALLAFGLVGTLLTIFGVAAGVAAGAIAAVAGVVSGVFAATVVNRLLHGSPQTSASYGDVLGRVGRIIVPVTPEGPGKVRVEVGGTSVDLIARARETLDVGEGVVVEEVTSDGEAQVSRAPKELAP